MGSEGWLLRLYGNYGWMIIVFIFILTIDGLLCMLTMPVLLR